MKLKTSHIFFLLLAIIGMNYIPTTKATPVCPEDHFYYQTLSHSDTTLITYGDRWYKVHVTLNIVEKQEYTYTPPPECAETVGSWIIDEAYYSGLGESKSSGIYTRWRWPKITGDYLTNDNPYIKAEGQSKRYIWYFDVTEIKIRWNYLDRVFEHWHWINGVIVYQ